MFDENGNLPPGFHDWSFSEIKERLVENFSKETNREGLFDGYSNLRDIMCSLNIDFEHWLDGSFCTVKDNPGDIDMVTHVEEERLNKLSKEEQRQFIRCVNREATKNEFGCHSFYVPSVPKDHPKFKYYRELYRYWYGEFGLDRKNQPKGIVRNIHKPEGK